MIWAATISANQLGASTEALTQNTIEFRILLCQKGWLDPMMFEICLHVHPTNDQKIHAPKFNSELTPEKMMVGRQSGFPGHLLRFGMTGPKKNIYPLDTLFFSLFGCLGTVKLPGTIKISLHHPHFNLGICTFQPWDLYESTISKATRRAPSGSFFLNGVVVDP